MSSRTFKRRKLIPIILVMISCMLMLTGCSEKNVFKNIKNSFVSKADSPLDEGIFIGNREDFRDETIYFVMTTRFYDGDSSNNVHCWDDAQAGNPDDDPAWRGDFKGLIDKLDYIKALGFTTVWITPVVENSSGYDYHGYHAINFSKVDERYESEGCSYQDLIDEVHARGMKIVQDVVFNHTGNFGESNLLPLFEKSGDLSTPDCLKIVKNSGLPDNYFDLLPSQQYEKRLALMKNTDGVNHDVNNIYHHFGNFNWDDYTSQLAQIAGDCVDLNTENPLVYNYLVDAYTKYIEMGVDGFRVDTTKHISRLTFNKAIVDKLNEAGGEDFYMFGEVCARARDVWYRDTPALSTPFYTWDESKDYAWSETDYTVNEASAEQHYNDNAKNVSAQPTSRNALLDNNKYHTPDYSQSSGLGVIDFPMHWNFAKASDAFRVAVNGDTAYNDATWNVTYVDSHDYAPDCAPEYQRFNQSQDTWAENLNLMFTFRGIPCIYYGSEIEFQKGAVIDKGPTVPLSETGRAYFGDNIEGTVDVTDFATYTNATGTLAETLNHPLAKHIQRLNKIRAAIPALRRGQYSTEGVSGNMAFVRRYTDKKVDSFVAVAITNEASFSNIPNGTYTDAITGDVVKVTNGSLHVPAPGKGNMRVYVLSTKLTEAPGKVGEDGKYLKGEGGNASAGSGSSDNNNQNNDNTNNDSNSVNAKIYMELPSGWGEPYVYIYDANNSSNQNASWPGAKMTKLDNGLYYYELTKSMSAPKVLFSDGTDANRDPGHNQPGFDLSGSMIYKADGTWTQYAE